MPEYGRRCQRQLERELALMDQAAALNTQVEERTLAVREAERQRADEVELKQEWERQGAALLSMLEEALADVQVEKGKAEAWEACCKEAVEAGEAMEAREEEQPWLEAARQAAEVCTYRSSALAHMHAA
jgi:hypothetical protein